MSSSGSTGSSMPTENRLEAACPGPLGGPSACADDRLATFGSDEHVERASVANCREGIDALKAESLHCAECPGVERGDGYSERGWRKPLASEREPRRDSRTPQSLARAFGTQSPSRVEGRVVVCHPGTWQSVRRIETRSGDHPPGPRDSQPRAGATPPGLSRPCRRRRKGPRIATLRCPRRAHV